MSDLILRTPDDRFAALPGYPFAPRYLEGLPGSLELPDAGHFVQEAGDRVARAALEAWALGG
jgi:hypothetical protein